MSIDNYIYIYLSKIAVSHQGDLPYGFKSYQKRKGRWMGINQTQFRGS